MVMVHFNAIFIAYLLVSQASVDATIDILNYANEVINSLSNRYATIIDGYIQGYIELASPPDACTEIQNPVFVPKGAMKNMVLINGTSECDFMRKIQNAKAVGYEVAVLFDPFPEPFNYTDMVFPIPSSEINMSVVLVSCKDGIDIRTNYLYPQYSEFENVIIIISPVWDIWRRFAIYTVAFIILLILGTLLCMLFYVIVKKIQEKCCSNRHEEEETDDHNENASEEMSEDFEREEMADRILKNLNTRFPSKVFSTEDPFEICAICFNDFQVGEMFRKLRCPHAYHTDCIDNWLFKKRQCPLCKNNVSLENSIELPPGNASDTTPLLASINDPSSTMRNRRPPNLFCDSLGFLRRSRSFGEIRSHLVEVLGSVNSVQGNASGGEEDTNAILA